MNDKLIRKDSTLLIVYCPKYMTTEVIAELENHIFNSCDEDVFPLLIQTMSNEFKIEMVNCQNLTEEKIEEIKELINQIK